MTQPGEPTPLAARKLGNQLSDHEERLQALEKGSRSPQLGNASLDNAFILAVDALGQAMMRIGVQDDATYGVLYFPGTPPPATSAPVLIPGELSVTVDWDGLFAGADRPKNFKRVDVHVSQSDAAFIPTRATRKGVLLDGGSVTIPADNDVTYVKLVSVAEGNVAGTPTAAVSTTPLPVSTLAAGSVGAIALAAQIILATTRFVVGNATGDRLELGPDGLAQFNAQNIQTLGLGPGPAAGNYLLIPDPVTGATLAGISSTGVLTCSGLAVQGAETINGEDIEEILAGKGGGEVAFFRSSAAWTGGTTTGKMIICSLDFTARAGRSYKVSTSPVLIRGDGSDPYAGVVSGLTMFYTTNGSTVTTSSPHEQGTFGFNDWTHSMNWTFRNDEAADITVKLGLGIESYGGSTQAVTPEISSSNPLELTVVDSGPIITATGVVGAATPPKNYTSTYSATWSKDFDAEDLVSVETAWPDAMVQGGLASNQQYVAMFGFNNSAIQSDLTGATIVKVELYLVSGWSYLNSGVDARIGTSTTSSEPANYPTTGKTLDRWLEHFNQPQSRWLNLGTAVGNEFKAGTTNSFILDATNNPWTLAQHGTFYEHGSLFNKPKLRITYTK